MFSSIWCAVFQCGDPGGPVRVQRELPGPHPALHPSPHGAAARQQGLLQHHRVSNTHRAKLTFQ